MAAEHRGTEMRRLMWPGIVLAAGVVVATLVAAMPQAMLDVLMWRLALPRVLPAATPPIGAIGRMLLALLVLIPFVALAAFALRRRAFLIGVQRKPALASPDIALRMPTIRRADAHPDAAPRPPIRAEEDLGPPLPMVAMPAVTRSSARAGEQALPQDLDQLLAAFDPVAIPDVPRDPVRAVPPLAPPPPVETITAATVQSSPPVGLDAATKNDDVRAMEEPRLDQPDPQTGGNAEPRVEPARSPAVGSGDSLISLLERLERGARQRKSPEPSPSVSPAPASVPAETPVSVSPPPPESLNDTLSMLRRMARR
jgi:hypothetical protein